MPTKHGRADLHLHTTHSDGTYNPSQVVELARRSGLAAIAITDHDTLAGIGPARWAARQFSLEVIAGVEVSADHHGRELHLLGYFVDPEDLALQGALDQLAAGRVARFQEMVARLKSCGVRVPDDHLQSTIDADAPGRRHLAEILVQTRQAGSVREAFTRYLGDGGRVAVPKVRLPAARAIAVIREAGGVASWAHPFYHCNGEMLGELCDRGLGALEAFYPGYRKGQIHELQALASRFGLAVTGGSDCHGPDERRRAIGSCSISPSELDALRLMARGRGR